jgi:hypothetical protein
MKPSKVKAALLHLMNRRRPAFLWGAPGVGKSDVVAQVASESNRQLVDVRLSTMDVVDIRGFPVPNLEKRVMEWLIANFLPPMMVPGKTKGKLVPNESFGLLFLDEMNSAPQAVQAAAYQLVLDHRIGDYILPANWSILAAGNRAGDRSVVNAMPAALANRFIHIDFEPDADDWQAWAAANGVSDVTRGFLRFKPSLLHSFDPSTNPRAFPSPRSWSLVDDVINSHLDSDTEYELIKGTVGEGAAAEYLTFARLARDLPSVDEILLAPDTAPVPQEPSAQYAICTALDAKANKNTIGRLLTYAERLPTEFQVLFMRYAAIANREITQTKEYTKWITANQDVLL